MPRPKATSMWNDGFGLILQMGESIMTRKAGKWMTKELRGDISIHILKVKESKAINSQSSDPVMHFPQQGFPIIMFHNPPTPKQSQLGITS